MTLQGSGRVLGGRYRLIRELARGGMAIVWEAEDTLLNRPVAIKLLQAQFGEDAEFLERFRREARAAARLSHPNIVSIYDVGEDTETRLPFIVMELVEGGNLKDRIRASAPLSDAEIRSIGAALAETLDYAHQRGIIHRDVKPQNVLLGHDGRPRLTDFGIAQAMASSSGLTRTGAVMGSVHYLAPELARGKPALPQSDIYALGAVLYEMATGRVPFEADSDLAVALAHIEQTAAPPRSLNPRLAPDLEQTIVRALAKQPAERFLTAADLGAALRGRPPAPARTAVPNGQPQGATQRLPAVSPGPVKAGRVTGTPRPPAPVRSTVVTAAPGVVPASRRTARPQRRPGGHGGLLSLLLAMAAVLVVLGAGFFGLASLSREGIMPPVPTQPPSPAATTPPKPAAAASSTATLVPTATSQPTETAEPSPSPSPSPQPTPSPVPPTPTPAPPTPTATPRAIPVPQLRGKTLEQALAALKADGLSTAAVRGVNVNVDKDVVVDQQPDTGATLPAGGGVTLLVGTGSTAIPEVANMPRDQAARTLQNNSFQVVIRQQRDPRVPADAAIQTNPPAGTIAPRNSQVELIVSTR